MANVTEEIAIKLGIKNSDLKAVLADSGAAIKAFKKSGESTSNDGLLGTLKKQTQGLNDLKQLLTGGAMAGAVKGFFNLAIDSANKSTDATDKNAEAVRNFGRGLEEMKGVAGKVAVAVVGFFNRVGEAVGDLQNMSDAFRKGGTAAVSEYQRMQKIVEETGRAAEEAERRLAETRKKNGAEFLAITKQLQQLEEKTITFRQKALTPMQQEQDLLMAAVKLRDQLVGFEGDAIDRRRIELKLAETGYALLEATAARKKEEAEAEKQRLEALKKEAAEEKKMYEEYEKAADERQRARALEKGEEVELFTLRSKNTATMTKAEKERLAVLELQKTAKAATVEIEEIEERIITGKVTPADKERLAQLVKQKQTIEEQIAGKVTLGKLTEQQIAAEKQVLSVLVEELRVQQMLTEEQARQAQIERSRTGTIKQKGDVQSLSDTQLEALVLNLNKTLAPIKQADAQYAGVGQRVGTYKSIEQYLLQQNLDAAIQEQRKRREFASTQNFFGSQYAEGSYAPDEFARLTQLMNPDLQKQQAANIAAITSTLQNIFPDQFPR